MTLIFSLYLTNISIIREKPRTNEIEKYKSNIEETKEGLSVELCWTI